jgi:hypothetical protein
MSNQYGLKTNINPRFDEEVCIAVLDYVKKHGWKQGVSYASIIDKLVLEIVLNSFDKDLVFEYNLFCEDQYKVDNKSTQIRTADKRSLVKVAKAKTSTMTELLNDQARKHMVLVAKR